jgi:putative nucleotidyltransferase with HDIG domain
MISSIPPSLADTIGRIKPMPVVVQRLCAMADAPDVDVREMARIMAADPALTARLLRVANSAFYGLSRQVTTVSYAISVLGVHTVRHIALATAIFGLRDRENVPLDLDAMWRHSVAVAGIAHMLASPMCSKDSETAFVGGLLHDIGRLILADHYKQDYVSVLRRAREEDVLLQVVESEAFGVSHIEVGRALCEHWQLPATLSAIFAHHFETVVPAGERQIHVCWLAVYAADQLAKLAGLGDDGDWHVTKDFLPLLRNHGIRTEQVHEVMRELPAQMRKLEALFDLPADWVRPLGRTQVHRSVSIQGGDAASQELAGLALVAQGYRLELPNIVTEGGGAGTPIDITDWMDENDFASRQHIDANHLRDWLHRNIEESGSKTYAGV